MRDLWATLSGSRQAVRDERGFALPTVLFMLLSVMAVVSVAVVASIQAQKGTVRDQRTKSALTTAESGATQALLNYNGGFSPSEASPCLMPVTNPPNSVQPRATQNSGSDSWCAPVTGSNGLGTFSYQVCPSTTAHPCAGTGTIEIVSTGTFSGVTRRVDVIARSVSGQQIFLDAGVKSQTNIVLDANAQVHSTASAGGSITLGSTSTKLCGMATVGPSGTVSGAGQYYANPDCTGPLSQSTVTHQPISLPPVNQGDAPYNNDNCRISRAIPVTDSNCTFNASDPKDLIAGTGVSWNPSTRVLSLTGQKSSLTLTGKTYSFCKLRMEQNSTLYVAPNSTVSIFFDKPENCGPLPAYNASSSSTQKATAQMWLESNTRITANGDPTALNIALYFVGSQTIPTGVLMSSNSDQDATCVQNFVLYGPLTQIEMNSNSTYCGAIAGQSIHLDQNAVFNTDDKSRHIVLPGSAPHYAMSRFVDCSSTPISAPNTGC
jgi:type II secretory pathway pseudopilin PulG